MNRGVSRLASPRSVLGSLICDSVHGGRGAGEDRERDPEDEMLEVLTIVGLEIREQIGDDWEAPLGRVGPKDVGQSSCGVRHILGQGEDHPLEDRWARHPRLEHRAVQKSLTGARQESRAGGLVEPWQLRSPAQQRLHQVEQERRSGARCPRPDQPCESHPASRTPSVEERPGERGDARRDQIIGGGPPQLVGFVGR